MHKKIISQIIKQKKEEKMIEDKQINEGASNLKIMKENMSVLSHVSEDIVKRHDEIRLRHYELGDDVNVLKSISIEQNLQLLEQKLRAIEKSV